MGGQWERRLIDWFGGDWMGRLDGGEGGDNKRVPSFFFLYLFLVCGTHDI